MIIMPALGMVVMFIAGVGMKQYLVKIMISVLMNGAILILDVNTPP
jgi:hypothetical protein